MNLTVKISKTIDSAIVPSLGTAESAGADLCTPAAFTIAAGQTRVIDTGLVMQAPPGFRIDIRPRSGLAAKHGLTVLNTPGTIDRDYCGPDDTIKIILHKVEKTFDPGRNKVKKAFDYSECAFEPGDRIAQMVLTPTYHWDWVLEDNPNFASVVNRDGLGSTGISSKEQKVNE